MFSSLVDAYNWLKRELNFFRIHLLFFVFVPFIAALIFWAANGSFHIAFIDALFLCYSALTVTGLATVNLSTCTVFQQVILFVLILIGNVTVVAWVMVLIRKSYFKQHLKNLRRQEHSKRKIANKLLQYIHRIPGVQTTPPHVFVSSTQSVAADPNDLYRIHSRFRAEEGIGPVLVGGGSTAIGMGIGLGGRTHSGIGGGNEMQLKSFQSSSEPGYRMSSESRPRTPSPYLGQIITSPTSGIEVLNSAASSQHHPRYRTGIPIPRTQTIIQSSNAYDFEHPSNQLGQRSKDQNLGGFPGPIQLVTGLFRRFLPKVHRKLRRITTLPTESHRRGGIQRLTGEFSHLVIGRNSDFNTDELTDDELERLGGLEYRALRTLSYLVFFYFVGTQLLSFILIAPWLSAEHRYNDVFLDQPRLVNKSWFTIFQVLGAYTGGGMSLVDAGMVPFQQAYLMIFSLIFAILAGNQGLPILLRCSIWILTKFVRDGSPAHQTLHFLLDHPRRCFLYLFPSHVTWFLVIGICILMTIEWVSFIVLNIGLHVTESLPVGARIVDGLFQSFAIRASGFAIVTLSDLAPAFQFLCVVMMYIAVYPVALSIRSTNVYEEQSLGVFSVPSDDEDEEPEIGEKSGTRRERIGKYFGWHLRREVAYDIWWLVWGIFVICIIERHKIMDVDNSIWFNIFRIVFELVSAFSGIGLSLGVPYDDYSFCGAFGPLSKLVVCVIMVRGRHRGLPVAIDRAILLPADLVPPRHDKEDEANAFPSAPVADGTENPVES